MNVEKTRSNSKRGSHDGHDDNDDEWSYNPSENMRQSLLSVVSVKLFALGPKK
mgnify:CR=1 FL=1